MTVLDDMLAKADEVLALDERATPGPWRSYGRSIDQLTDAGKGYPLDVYPDSLEIVRCGDDGGVCRDQDSDLIASYRNSAPDLARALKAVAEALEEAEQSRWGPVPHPLRAAIERRLTEGK